MYLPDFANDSNPICNPIIKNTHISRWVQQPIFTTRNYLQIVQKFFKGYLSKIPHTPIRARSNGHETNDIGRNKKSKCIPVCFSFSKTRQPTVSLYIKRVGSHTASTHERSPTSARRLELPDILRDRWVPKTSRLPTSDWRRVSWRIFQKKKTPFCVTFVCVPRGHNTTTGFYLFIILFLGAWNNGSCFACAVGRFYLLELFSPFRKARHPSFIIYLVHGHPFNLFLLDLRVLLMFFVYASDAAFTLSLLEGLKFILNRTMFVVNIVKRGGYT